ncbi:MULTISPECIES: hypothetical protein [Amycolatopsis]|uniref:hypothetical protein n=1 Tax=Amycolatopsis TaxID=1813 RepID=UPI0031F80720
MIATAPDAPKTVTARILRRPSRSAKMAEDDRPERPGNEGRKQAGEGGQQARDVVLRREELSREVNGEIAVNGEIVPLDHLTGGATDAHRELPWFSGDNFFTLFDGHGSPLSGMRSALSPSVAGPEVSPSRHTKCG